MLVATANSIPRTHKAMANKNKRKELFEYPAKILVAFGEAVSGNMKIHKWLLTNNYVELAALAAALQADKEAFTWLMTHGFNHFAAYCNAVDGDNQAKEWLIKHKFDFLVVMVDAIELNPVALAWFKKHNLPIFTVINHKIYKLKEAQHREYNNVYKIHFN